MNWQSLGASVVRGLVVSTFAAGLPAMGQNPPAPAPVPAPAAAAQQGVVSGKVTDKAGKPVAKARVHLAGPDFQSVQTDAQGNYSFRTVKAAGQYQIGVEAQGFLTIEYWRDRNSALQLTPQSQVKRDMVLERGASIVVTVTNEAGDAVRGARIFASPLVRDYRGGADAHSAMSDDSGTAMLTVPPSKKQYIISADLDGFAPAHAQVAAESIDEPVDVALALERGQSVKGVAICNDGKPATGWQIYAAPDWWTSGYSRQPAKIDAQGNFTLKDLGPGVHKLSLGIPRGNNGTMVQELQMTLTVPAAQQPIRVDLPMASPGAQVKAAGKVRVTGGRPDYVSVNAIGAGPQANSYAQVDFGRSVGRPGKDSVIEGSYTLEGISAGTYQLRFESPTTEMKTLEQVKIPGEIPVVELKMVGKPHLVGTVSDAATGAAISAFSIRIAKVGHLGNGPSYGQEPRWTQVSGTDGKFDLEVISPGIYKVQAMADGHAVTWSKEIRLENAEAKTDLQIKLTAGGTLGGVVVDGSGKPVEGAKVSPFSVAGYNMRPELRRQVEHFDPDLGAVKTDAAGRFTLEHLGGGDEKVRVVHPGFAPKVVTGLKVAEGQTADAGTIKLSGGGAAEGIVYDENGKPAAGVPLEFRDQEGWSSGEDELAGRLAQVATDEEGRFRVEHLPEMITYVAVQDAWNRMGTNRRIIRPVEGKTTHLDFGGPNAVTGTIAGAMGPVAGARIQLAGESAYTNATASGRTDAAGRFTLYGPPAGKYSLYYSTDMNRRNWTWVKDLEITGKAADLGELKPEGTDLLITVESDDAADLQSVQYVTLEPQEGGVRYIQAERDAASGKWRAKSVPAGKYRAAAGGKANVSFITAVECDGKEKEKAIGVRVPKATATLSASMARIEGLPDEVRQVVVLANDDMTVATYFSSQGEQPRTVKLPPGTYRVLDQTTRKPVEGVPTITLGDGESKTVELAPPKVRTNAKTVAVRVWSASGVLVSGSRPRVLDSDGKAVEMLRGWYMGNAYALVPGRYRAVVDRPDAKEVTKEFEVAEGEKMVGVDVYMPE